MTKDPRPVGWANRDPKAAREFVVDAGRAFNASHVAILTGGAGGLHVHSNLAPDALRALVAAVIEAIDEGRFERTATVKGAPGGRA